MSDLGWIGVDLDGTLAEYHGWKSEGGIGPPIPRMLNRVKAWLAEGKDVRIFTARVGHRPAQDSAIGLEGQTYSVAEIAAQHDLIRAWCLEHLDVELPITCQKDFRMIELWDDRCVQVVTNTGRTLEEQLAATAET